MGAHHDGTRAQSAGLEEKVSVTDTRRGWPRERGSWPLGVEEAGNLMEKCLLAPHCGMRHRPTACEKFKDLSLQHRQLVIAEKELCASCLRHSDLNESKKRDCIRRMAPPHWVGSSVRRPGKSPSRERELPPPVEAKAGSYAYIIVSGSFLFSGFNRFPHFIPPTTVYKCQLNKVLRVQPFLFRVPLPPGGPRRQAERGMALVAVNEF
jgi:hypothetical protein